MSKLSKKFTNICLWLETLLIKTFANAVYLLNLTSFRNNKKQSIGTTQIRERRYNFPFFCTVLHFILLGINKFQKNCTFGNRMEISLTLV